MEFVFVPRLDLRSVLVVLFEKFTSGAPDATDASVAAPTGPDEDGRFERRDPYRKC